MEAHGALPTAVTKIGRRRALADYGTAVARREVLLVDGRIGAEANKRQATGAIPRHSAGAHRARWARPAARVYATSSHSADQQASAIRGSAGSRQALGVAALPGSGRSCIRELRSRQAKERRIPRDSRGGCLTRLFGAASASSIADQADPRVTRSRGSTVLAAVTGSSEAAIRSGTARAFRQRGLTSQKAGSCGWARMEAKRIAGPDLIGMAKLSITKTNES
jgi:hypothetical protein